jgi:hypothetical protein
MDYSSLQANDPPRRPSSIFAKDRHSSVFHFCLRSITFSENFTTEYAPRKLAGINRVPKRQRKRDLLSGLHINDVAD